jgi:hypothetical protein
MRQTTRISVALVFTFVALASNLDAQSARPAGAPSPPVLRVRISTGQNIYKKNADVPLFVEITNVGSSDILIGRDLLSNASPSQVRFYVTPEDGHALSYHLGAVDGLPAHALDDLPRAVLRWCLVLEPDYSYGVTIPLQAVVVASGLVPGIYHVHVEYLSSGMDANTYFNPLLGHPDELARFLTESWKGHISSNKITFRIAP